MSEYVEFFESLTPFDQVTILEAALQGLRDELSDDFMRQMDVLDITDEHLEQLVTILADFMERI